MISFIQKKQPTWTYRVLCALIAFSFAFSVIVPPTPIYAQAVPQSVLNLPLPGTMVGLTSGFNPPLVKGITVHPDNPLKFDFLISSGDNNLTGAAFRDESKRLIKYFLAGLTVPDDQLWVNLSPYEKNRIISEQFGQTEMGRDMLAQDYILKQLTASLMYPEEQLGKKFWDRVYKKALEQYGTTEIPMNTFNKIWIVPETAVVYENEQTAFVVESHLKVMLEEDYLALEHHIQKNEYGQSKMENRSSILDPRSSQSKKNTEVISGVQSEIVRELLVPEIEREVNEGEIFTQLRQIYNSIILATWYKSNLKESLLGKIYVDQGKTKGVNVKDTQINQKIYDQYVEAFKKGVYNYIKEDYDPSTKQIIPRKYFSGGLNFFNLSITGIREDITEVTPSQARAASSPVSKFEVDLVSHRGVPEDLAKDRSGYLSRVAYIRDVHYPDILIGIQGSYEEESSMERQKSSAETILENDTKRLQKIEKQILQQWKQERFDMSEYIQTIANEILAIGEQLDNKDKTDLSSFIVKTLKDRLDYLESYREEIETLSSSPIRMSEAIESAKSFLRFKNWDIDEIRKSIPLDAAELKQFIRDVERGRVPISFIDEVIVAYKEKRDAFTATANTFRDMGEEGADPNLSSLKIQENYDTTKLEDHIAKLNAAQLNMSIPGMHSAAVNLIKKSKNFNPKTDNADSIALEIEAAAHFIPLTENTLEQLIRGEIANGSLDGAILAYTSEEWLLERALNKISGISPEDNNINSTERLLIERLQENSKVVKEHLKELRNPSKGQASSPIEKTAYDEFRSTGKPGETIKMPDGREIKSGRIPLDEETFTQLLEALSSDTPIDYFEYIIDLYLDQEEIARGDLTQISDGDTNTALILGPKIDEELQTILDHLERLDKAASENLASSPEVQGKDKPDSAELITTDDIGELAEVIHTLPSRESVIRILKEKYNPDPSSLALNPKLIIRQGVAAALARSFGEPENITESVLVSKQLKWQDLDLEQLPFALKIELGVGDVRNDFWEIFNFLKLRTDKAKAAASSPLNIDEIKQNLPLTARNLKILLQKYIAGDRLITRNLLLDLQSAYQKHLRRLNTKANKLYKPGEEFIGPELKSVQKEKGVFREHLRLIENALKAREDVASSDNSALRGNRATRSMDNGPLGDLYQLFTLSGKIKTGQLSQSHKIVSEFVNHLVMAIVTGNLPESIFDHFVNFVLQEKIGNGHLGRVRDELLRVKNSNGEGFDGLQQYSTTDIEVSKERLKILTSLSILDSIKMTLRDRYQNQIIDDRGAVRQIKNIFEIFESKNSEIDLVVFNIPLADVLEKIRSISGKKIENLDPKLAAEMIEAVKTGLQAQEFAASSPLTDAKRAELIKAYDETDVPIRRWRTLEIEQKSRIAIAVLRAYRSERNIPSGLIDHIADSMKNGKSFKAALDNFEDAGIASSPVNWKITAKNIVKEYSGKPFSGNSDFGSVTKHAPIDGNLLNWIKGYEYEGDDGEINRSDSFSASLSDPDRGNVLLSGKTGKLIDLDEVKGYLDEVKDSIARKSFFVRVVALNPDGKEGARFYWIFFENGQIEHSIISQITPEKNFKTPDENIVNVQYFRRLTVPSGDPVREIYEDGRVKDVIYAEKAFGEKHGVSIVTINSPDGARLSREFVDGNQIDAWERKVSNGEADHASSPLSGNELLQQKIRNIAKSILDIPRKQRMSDEKIMAELKKVPYGITGVIEEIEDEFGIKMPSDLKFETIQQFADAVSDLRDASRALKTQESLPEEPEDTVAFVDFNEHIDLVEAISDALDEYDRGGIDAFYTIQRINSITKGRELNSYGFKPQLLYLLTHMRSITSKETLNEYIDLDSSEDMDLDPSEIIDQNLSEYIEELSRLMQDQKRVSLQINTEQETSSSPLNWKITAKNIVKENSGETFSNNSKWRFGSVTKHAPIDGNLLNWIKGYEYEGDDGEINRSDSFSASLSDPDRDNVLLSGKTGKPIDLDEVKGYLDEVEEPIAHKSFFVGVVALNPDRKEGARFYWIFFENGQIEHSTISQVVPENNFKTPDGNIVNVQYFRRLKVLFDDPVREIYENGKLTDIIRAEEAFGENHGVSIVTIDSPDGARLSREFVDGNQIDAWERKVSNGEADHASLLVSAHQKNLIEIHDRAISHINAVNQKLTDVKFSKFQEFAWGITTSKGMPGMLTNEDLTLDSLKTAIREAINFSEKFNPKSNEYPAKLISDLNRRLENLIGELDTFDIEGTASSPVTGIPKEFYDPWWEDARTRHTATAGRNDQYTIKVNTRSGEVRISASGDDSIRSSFYLDREPMEKDRSDSAREVAREIKEIVDDLLKSDPEIKDLSEPSKKSIDYLIGEIKKQLKAEAASSPVTMGEFTSPIIEQRAPSNEVGGINLNPALMDLQIKRDGNGIPLPFELQPAEVMNIEGFIPVIINVTPVINLPLLLGWADTETDTESPIYNTQLGPMDTQEQLKGREPEKLSYLN